MRMVLRLFLGYLMVMALLGMIGVMLIPASRLYGFIGLAVVIAAIVVWWIVGVRGHTRAAVHCDAAARRVAREPTARVWRQSFQWVDRTRRRAPF